MLVVLASGKRRSYFKSFLVDLIFYFLISQWRRSDVAPGQKNTIVTSYNRNFAVSTET